MLRMNKIYFLKTFSAKYDNIDNGFAKIIYDNKLTIILMFRISVILYHSLFFSNIIITLSAFISSYTNKIGLYIFWPKCVGSVFTAYAFFARYHNDSFFSASPS